MAEGEAVNLIGGELVKLFHHLTLADSAWCDTSCFLITLELLPPPLETGKVIHSAYENKAKVKKIFWLVLERRENIRERKVEIRRRPVST
jgi:hypothetical protein